jgi:hypothetical protein
VGSGNRGASRERNFVFRQRAAAAQLDSRNTTVTACHFAGGFFMDPAYGGERRADIGTPGYCD